MAEWLRAIFHREVILRDFPETSKHQLLLRRIPPIPRPIFAPPLELLVLAMLDLLCDRPHRMIVHVLDGLLLQLPPHLVSQVGVYGPPILAQHSSLRVPDPLEALIHVE